MTSAAKRESANTLFHGPLLRVSAYSAPFEIC